MGFFSKWREARQIRYATEHIPHEVTYGFWKKQHTTQPEKIQNLLKRFFIYNKNQKVRMRVYGMLISLGHPISNEIFALALKDSDVELRKQAVDAWYFNFTNLAENVDIELFLRAFDDPDWQVRSTALRSLDKMPRDPRLLEAAIRCLNDSHYLVVEQAITTLGGIGDKDIVPKLLPFLSGKEIDVRKAINALSRIGDQAAVESIIPFLDDPHAWVREDAERALKTLGGETAEAALKESEERQFAARVIVECICILPDRFVKKASSSELRNILDVCARFAGTEVCKKYKIESQARDVMCFTNDPSYGAGVRFTWKVAEVVRERIAETTRQEWEELIAEIDQHGVAALLRAGKS